jgi:lipid-binding SYLF domain-containing protein
MRRKLSILVLAVAVACAGFPAHAASEAEELADKARLTAEKMLSHPDFTSLRNWMSRAKGVLIVPSLLKASFFIGGEGGNGVLLARDANGNWSYPAFYSIGSASLGFQAGFQDAEVMFVIMTDRGLDAVISNQVKLGADASIAIGPKGAGVEGATTTALTADIYSFSITRGLFGGVSFEGSLVYKRDDLNQAYYRTPAGPRAIVLERRFSNPHAEPLRAALTVR